MAPAMPSTGHSIASDSTTGFLLVSTYSWTLITLGTVIVRFVQGVILRKVEMGVDDAAIIAASVRRHSRAHDVDANLRHRFFIWARQSAGSMRSMEA